MDFETPLLISILCKLSLSNKELALVYRKEIIAQPANIYNMRCTHILVKYDLLIYVTLKHAALSAFSLADTYSPTYALISLKNDVCLQKSAMQLLKML